MRADRLISLLMLLEAKKSVTAQELAQQLEVTERTIYRDIDSLCAAGVPIIGISGHNGGYRLMEGYSTGLRGLNKEEALALLSLSIPEHFEHTEIGARLKSSILKIRSTYKSTMGKGETGSRLYIDMSSWEQSDQAPTMFNALYLAIYNNRKLLMTYTLPIYAIRQSVKLIEPYGLVSKENKWYLVYYEQKKLQVLGLSNIIHIEETSEEFVYPQDFKLEEFWQRWCNDIQDGKSKFQVTAMVQKCLRANIGEYIKGGSVPMTPIPIKPEKQEWVQVELWFDSFEEARSRLLSFGGAVKILEPMSLKYSILDFAEQVQNLYK